MERRSQTQTLYASAELACWTNNSNRLYNMVSAGQARVKQCRYIGIGSSDDRKLLHREFGRVTLAMERFSNSLLWQTCSWIFQEDLLTRTIAGHGTALFDAYLELMTAEVGRQPGLFELEKLVEQPLAGALWKKGARPS